MIVVTWNSKTKRFIDFERPALRSKHSRSPRRTSLESSQRKSEPVLNFIWKWDLGGRSEGGSQLHSCLQCTSTPGHQGLRGENSRASVHDLSCMRFGRPGRWPPNHSPDTQAQNGDARYTHPIHPICTHINRRALQLSESLMSYPVEWLDKVCW